MSWTASSEVPKYFTLALQPVCCSNGVTQSTFGSLEPSSAYPGHARMFTEPSIVPIFCCMGTSGTVKPPAVVVPDDDDEPQPATRARAAAPTTAPRTRCARVCLLMFF